MRQFFERRRTRLFRERKNIVRLILFLLAVGIAAGAFANGVLGIGRRESGFNAVDYTMQGKSVLYDSGVHLQYYAEGDGGAIKQKLNEVQKLYTDLLLRGYMLLDAEHTYENCPNIASLNAAPGEWVTLDPDLTAILRDALERTERGEGYSVFSGALHREWRTLRYLEDASSADPLNDREEKRLLGEMADQIAAPGAFALEIEDGRARLAVGEAYRAWAEENEIDAPALDLNLLHDAYLLELTAKGLSARGYTDWYLYTDSGLSVLTAPSGEMVYGLPAVEGREMGEIKLASPSAWCAFTAFAPEDTKYGYYTVDKEGKRYLRHPYVNTRTGDIEYVILTAALGGTKQSAVDLAYGMILLTSAPSPDEACALLTAFPEEMFAAFTLQDDAEHRLHTSAAGAGRVKLNEGFAPVPHLQSQETAL
jgi:hypothetical protein